MRYSFEHSAIAGTPVIILADNVADTRIWIAPALGNRAVRLEREGHNFLYWRPGEFSGIPFMAPWSNRMSRDGFWTNGQWNEFASPQDLPRDANGFTIHGLLVDSPLWEVAGFEASAESVSVTCALNFEHRPELLANWPLKHRYEMTYRLSEGIIEVAVALVNLDQQPMPVAVGFHPYFVLPGAARDEISIHVPARQRVVTNDCLLATGEFEPVSIPAHAGLKEHNFDDGFTDLIRGTDRNARFAAEGGDWRIETALGPGYMAAIVYAPQGHDYICIEPMAAITDGISLHAAGKYPALQWLQAEETWRESFWISISRR